MENCQVIEIKSWNVEQAISMFNSLNSDGMPLSDSDIISSKLYSYIAEDERMAFNESWVELKSRIKELEKCGITNIDNVLNQYMYYKRTINGETKSQSNTIDVTVPGLRRYFIDENTSLIKNPKRMVEELSKLVVIWEEIKDFSLVKILLKLNANSKLFLASYLFRFSQKDIDKKSICEIVECLIKLFVLLEVDDIGYSSKKFKTFLFEEEIKFVDKNVLNSEIIQDFNNHIITNWKKEEIEKLIEEYSNHALVPLNEYLFSVEKNLKFVLKEDYDIEHIMPISSRYSKAILDDAKMENVEEFEIYVNKIGNKIVLEKEINRGIGDNWFKAKLSIHNELKN